jgi:hypothetical protein
MLEASLFINPNVACLTQAEEDISITNVYTVRLEDANALVIAKMRICGV